MFAGACPQSPDSVVLLWMARCDVSEPNAVQAHIIWQQSGCELTPDHVLEMLKFLGHQHGDVRLACADALAVGLLVSLCRCHCRADNRQMCSRVVESLAQGGTALTDPRGLDHLSELP